MHVFLSTSSKKTIFIYNGPGVSKESLRQIRLAIIEKFSDFYFIKQISPTKIIKDYWEEEAALFILPGGSDIPYAQALNGIGNQKIKNYVEKGGAFLGICAGSYYAGAFVDFAKGTPIEIQGKRELGFFPGVVKGPILAPYDYLSQSGSRAAKLIWNDEEEFEKNELFITFYNGGGYFLKASNYKNVSVLAFYDRERNFPAIIQCKVGHGITILSGVHFEYNPFLLDSENPHLKKILPDIFKGNKQRELLFTHLLKRMI